MQEIRPSPRAAAHPAEDRNPSLRQLGARAHQLQATTRAADHFNAQDGREDRNTGSWLMSCALGLAGELASDVDGLARSLKEGPVDTAVQLKVAAIRVRAHQLHAASRAADHFLDQDTQEDRETGSWLIATAYGLAQKLASEIDDSVLPVRRPLLDKVTIEPHDASLVRRVAEATAPLR
jgi:hypothetical protein